jgi:hypothetical protein
VTVIIAVSILLRRSWGMTAFVANSVLSIPLEWTERISGPCRADFAGGPTRPTRSPGRSTSVHEARVRKE